MSSNDIFGAWRQHWVVRYPIVTATLLIGIIGTFLWLSGLHVVVWWTFAVFSFSVAVVAAWGMAAQLRTKTFGVDVLAIIAIVATVLVGEVVASIVIVLMLSGGKALEDFAQNRAKHELDALLRKEPQKARRQDPQTGDVQEIPVDDVTVGDLLLVRSGELVPVDGDLVSEKAVLDESSVTGENLPVERSTHDRVLSGSINGPIAATIAATATAADSEFQAIVALVKGAAQNRAHVVRLADRYAFPFTLLSLAIASAAWIASGEAIRFAEVLVLATPCPLILAAPVAFIGGMSRAARNGVIVKGGSALEIAARARTVVCDKTGTLTVGSPMVTRILPAQNFSDHELFTLVASAERYSSHVLAGAITQSASREGLTLLEVAESEEREAQGVTATLVDNNRQHVTVAVGTYEFIHHVDPAVTPTATSGGELAIYSAVNGRFAGSIIAKDPVRSEAASTLRELQTLGIDDIIMLTGDAKETALAIASTVGIDQVHSECLPQEKVDIVKTLPKRPVIMVGDGVNDSPVLASADIGIAMGARGATAASEAASVVILVDDFSRTSRFVRMGKDTVRIALQSIWLGIALSIGLMSIASFGVISATLGAVIQEVVDLAAILNALRAIYPHERRAEKSER